MSATRGRAEMALAILFTLALLAGGSVAIWVASVQPVHEDPATIRSVAAAQPSAAYVGPVEESRRLARAVLVAEDLPGLSVAVAVDGHIVWAEGFGWADVDRRTPVTPTTRYRLGALSKPIMAAAVARLSEEGRLDLDAPIQRYVPAYPAKPWTLTTRQLLGDVGGVHRIRGDGNDAMPGQHCATLGEGVALVAHDPLLFEPGTQHRYSIWGWVVASAVLEGAAGEPLGRVMTREVFEPLAMERTVVLETEDLDVATPFYSSRASLRIPVPLSDDGPEPPDYSCLGGAGAFVSTPTDLVKLGSAMLRPAFLKPDTVAMFQTPVPLPSGAETTYALGWTVSTVMLAGRPTRMVSHRGSPRGGTAALLTFPERGVAVAATVNGPSPGRVDPFALHVAEAFTRGE